MQQRQLLLIVASYLRYLNLSAKGIRIPVLGPIIVAVTSILSGDPLGKTLFKTLGTVWEV